MNLLKFIQNSKSKKEESNKKKEEPQSSGSIKEKTAAPVAKFLLPAVAKIKQNDHNAHIFFPWQEAVQTAIYRKNDNLIIVFNKRLPFEFEFSDTQTDKPFITNYKIIDIDKSLTYIAIRLNNKQNLNKLHFGYDNTTHILQISANPISSEYLNILKHPFTTPSSSVQFAIDGFQTASLINFTDPIDGEKMAALTFGSKKQSIKNEFNFIDFNILKSIQGVIIRKKSDDLSLNFANNILTITARRGLNISPKFYSQVNSNIYQNPSFFRFQKFNTDNNILSLGSYVKPLKDFIIIEQAIKKQLHNANVANETNIHINLALFYLANNYISEAHAILDYVANVLSPNIVQNYDFALVYAATNFMNKNFHKAYNILSAINFLSIPVKHVKEFIFWQNVINIAKLNSERKPIPLDYQQNLSFLKFYPKNLLVESLLQFLEYQIINNRMKYCYDITNILSEQKLSPIEKARFLLLETRMSAKQDEKINLLEQCEKITKASLQHDICLAKLTDYNLSDNKITLTESIDIYRSLVFKARNSKLEINLILRLVDLYIQNKQYLEALIAINPIRLYYQDAPEALSAIKQQTKLFVDIILHNLGNYSAFNKVAIFNEFQDLNPIGTVGDRVALALTNYLLSLDLNEAAEKILTHQVNYRLSGYKKEYYLNILMQTYLNMNMYEKIIQLVEPDKFSVLTEKLEMKRENLYATALYKQKKYNAAINILRKNLSEDADNIRQNIYWEQKDWHKFNDNSEPYIYNLMEKNLDITYEDSMRILKQAIAYSYAKKYDLLNNLNNFFHKKLASKNHAASIIINYLTEIGQMKKNDLLDTSDIQAKLNDVYTQLSAVNKPINE